MLDDFSTGSRANLTTAMEHQRFHLVEGSVLDRHLVTGTIAGADRVIHLAAAVGVRRIIEHPLESLRVNLHGTENVLEAALQAHATVVLASTSEIYGKNTADKLPEDSDRILGVPADLAMELRGGQGHRRGLRARLLARARSAGVHRPAVQHGGPAPDRPLRHGGAQPGRPGAAGRAADRVR